VNETTGACVAIDVRMADAPGIGTYLRNLVPRVLAARPSWRFVLLGRLPVIDGLGWNEHENALVRPLDAPIYGVREQFALARGRTGRIDAFWSPHYNIPLWARAPLVVTVHDLIHLTRPEYTNSRSKQWYARRMFAAIRRRAAAILTVSEFTKGEFLRLVGPPRGPIVVAHNGVDERWFHPVESSLARSPAPYILSIASLKSHKNLIALIDAFTRVCDRLPHHLVIVGRIGGLRTPDTAVLGAVAACGGRVQLTGEVSDVALRSLVAGASALVHPSLYEGFGLPPLEAMASGCPCLVSQTTAMPEVCGDAVLYCNPGDPNDIAARLYQLVTDERLKADLSIRGRARAATFQWSNTAGRTLEVLDQVISRVETGRRRPAPARREIRPLVDSRDATTPPN
jgi:glycosyltransferase involved in cell wall biosynthesis